MALIESSTDEQGIIHNRYQQEFKGIKVEGAEIFEHVRDCYVFLLHGKIIEGLDFNVQPTYTEQQALTAALAYFGATEFAWENSSWEEDIKDDTGDTNATYYPKGEKVLTYVPGTALETANYRLWWKFEIVSTIPHRSEVVYINASTGIMLKAQPMGRDNGPAATSYDGTQTIDTKWSGGLFHGHYHLVADDNGKNIETRSGSGESAWKKVDHVFDNDDIWGTDAPTMRTTGAHWIMTRSWDYFRDTYARNGANNSNGLVRVYGNSTLGDNAQYLASISNNSIAYFEFGVSSGLLFGIPAGVDFASLDVGGHEFTHAVTENEADLVYEGEPGALNESFSDIFGTMIEGFARNGNFNWTLGEDLGFVLRDMQAPALGFTSQPSTYLTDPSWIPTNGCTPGAGNDFCGVHTNSGVQNHWFFLLSQGGTQNGVNVQGIGRANAALIAYSNLRNFLGTNSDHPAARLGAIAAARIIFGDCSNEVVQTTNAWAAVGVGAVFAGPCISLDGDRILCIDPSSFPYSYTAQAPPGATFTWSIPPMWSGYAAGPGGNTFYVTNFGNYNPIGGFPAIETISVTSSFGTTAAILVKVFEGCSFLCGGTENKNSSTGENDAFKTPVMQLLISPNPTKSQIKVSCLNAIPNSITIYTAIGQKVLDTTATKNETIIDVSDFPQGIYCITLQFGSETVTKKFVKMN